MHVLATELATLEEADVAVDLGQSPADIVVLSFSDSDLSALAAAWQQEADLLPTMRLASLKRLKHPMSVDLYVESVVARARLVIVRCLGGLDYWRYGLEHIADTARERGILFAALPGDDRADPRLASVSTLATGPLATLDRFFREGGTDNLRQALRYAGTLLGRDLVWTPPVPVGPVSVLGRAEPGLPVALIVFYRANLMAADTAPITALMAALDRQGLAPLAVALNSLKDPLARPELKALIATHKPSIILNTTAFSARAENDTTVLDDADAPVLQVVLSGSPRAAWDESQRGLSPADLAMNVVLPELDGRLLTRAISFKSETTADPRLEFAGVRHEPAADRIDYVARLAAAWAKLRGAPRHERRLALVLSDYPARGGRTGYAVGLDTAASAAGILTLLKAEGYDTGRRDWRAADIERLLAGDVEHVEISPTDSLSPELQRQLIEAWGEPADAFRLPVLSCGKVLVLLQPDRGSAGVPKSGYHDTSSPPSHAYVAAYAWVRDRIDALIHLGTHGTLEWLPGKALALSSGCWPEVVLGPLPVIYPFIVNNPGEAVQAKRRLGAVTIGHLTPPLSAAGLHGPLAELEGIIEEYAAADGLDRRRLAYLEEEIVERAWTNGLAADCGLVKGEPNRQAIAKLDAQPRAIPTRTAAAIGVRAADEVVRRYLQDHGEPPRALVIDLWASASLRTGGDDLAQALWYLGVKPVWDKASSRVTGIEILPLAVLDRPRIDVTLRISGLFRDIFEAQIALFDMAVRRVAALDEPAEDNPLAEAHRAGADLARVFGGAPGSYGAQAADTALDGQWRDRAELGEVYLAAVTHAYGGAEAVQPSEGFRNRVSEADVLVHPQDDRERDLLDGDGVADFAGGFAAAAALLGNEPELYHLDTSQTANPKARRIAEEIARVVRGRLTNPRWLSGMLGHGHRGVAEIAQGVDALYAFAATAGVPGHLFDATHAALIADDAIRAAMLQKNPAAAAAIAVRLHDALARGLWVTRRNAVDHELSRLMTEAGR